MTGLGHSDYGQTLWGDGFQRSQLCCQIFEIATQTSSFPALNAGKDDNEGNPGPCRAQTASPMAYDNVLIYLLHLELFYCKFYLFSFTKLTIDFWLWLITVEIEGVNYEKK